jgi:hypothetical protein
MQRSLSRNKKLDKQREMLKNNKICDLCCLYLNLIIKLKLKMKVNIIFIVVVCLLIMVSMANSGNHEYGTAEDASEN